MIKKGFTLIELLIVIAVLGILAIAVLAAINPIEQINRSRDTGSRSDAEQLLSAIDRYYASVGYYPWETDEDTPPPVSTGPTLVAVAWIDDDDVSVLEKLGSGATSGTGELKESFTNRIVETDYNDLTVYNRGTQGDSTYVCFLPRSGSFLDAAEKRCGTGMPDDIADDVASDTMCPDTAWLSCLP
ncbi:type II secretion system protein [Patescibacteria group bacterium]